MTSTSFWERNGSFAPVKSYNIKYSSSQVPAIVEEVKVPANGFNPAQAVGKGDGESGGNLIQLLQRKLSYWIEEAKNSFKTAFLPNGYPDSVSEEYLIYNLYDTIQEMAFGLADALTTSVIYKAGIQTSQAKDGDSSMAVAATLGIATIMLLRQACRKIGPVCFALIECSTFDAQNKKWRFFADILHNFGMFLEVCTLLLTSPTTFVLLCCFASLLRGIVTIIGTATRISLFQHFATINNTAEIVAKERFQINLNQLVCLVLVCTFLEQLIQSDLVTFIVFFCIVGTHIFCNYCGLRVLRVKTLNEARLLISLDAYFKEGRIPSVKEANQAEYVVFGLGIADSDVCGYKINTGVSLNSAITQFDVSGSSWSNAKEYLEQFQQRPFIIFHCPSKLEMMIVINDNIYEDPEAMFEAYTRAIFTAYHNFSGKVCHEPMSSFITDQVVKFRTALQGSGFNINNVGLNKVGNWRFSFDKCKST